MRSTTASVQTVVNSYVRNREDAADLVQEVYLKALRALPGLDDTERVRPWLFAIARNVALDHHRRARRRPVAQDDEFPESAVADDDPTPEDLVELRELAVTVQTGVGRLAPLDATLIAMVTVLGFTPSDISTALGMSHTAAKVAVHRARRRLRLAMELEGTAGTKGRSGCDDFRSLASEGDLVAAAIHARGCGVCARGRVAATA
jgi:RNA polymerase sigma factor (sigma-70 family)